MVKLKKKVHYNYNCMLHIEHEKKQVVIKMTFIYTALSQSHATSSPHGQTIPFSFSFLISFFLTIFFLFLGFSLSSS